MAGAEDRRKPERFKFPTWSIPIGWTWRIVGGAMIYDNHDTNIALRKDMAYVLRHMDDIKEERKKLRADIDQLYETRESTQQEILQGINELIAQRKKK